MATLQLSFGQLPIFWGSDLPQTGDKAHAATCELEERERGLAAAASASSSSVANLSRTNADQCSAGMLSRTAQDRVV